MLYNLFQFLAGSRFPKLPAARLERSSFLLAAEPVVAVEPDETKLAIKKPVCRQAERECKAEMSALKKI